MEGDACRFDTVKMEKVPLLLLPPDHPDLSVRQGSKVIPLL